jgi:thiol-disulfide isomerase/thioredoxin
MNHTRAFFLLVASLSTILISSSAAPAQSRKAGAAKLPAAVREIDPKALQGLLKRETARPLLVNFWATWCDPCREEFPELVKIDTQYREKGLDFIAVSLDDLAEIKTAVPAFLREMRATMPAYLLNAGDPDVAVSAVDPEWHGALPATFLFDSQGKITYKRFGRIKPLELRAAIEKVMSDK